MKTSLCIIPVFVLMVLSCMSFFIQSTIAASSPEASEDFLKEERVIAAERNIPIYTKEFLSFVEHRWGSFNDLDPATVSSSNVPESFFETSRNIASARSMQVYSEEFMEFHRPRWAAFRQKEYDSLSTLGKTAIPTEIPEGFQKMTRAIAEVRGIDPNSKEFKEFLQERWEGYYQEMHKDAQNSASNIVSVVEQPASQLTLQQYNRIVKLIEEGKTEAAKATIETLLEIHPHDPQLNTFQKRLSSEDSEVP